MTLDKKNSNKNSAVGSDDSEPSTSRKMMGSSLAVGSMTMLSRVMGLLRDIVLARFFGAGGQADAFFVAFRIPQFLRRLFAEGAFAQAFVPVLSEYRQNRELKGDVAAVKELVNAVCGVLGGTLIFVTTIVVLAAPLVTMLFAPGFINAPEKFSLTVSMLRITFPYLLLISLTGFAGAILNSYDRFAVPAFTPVLLNLSLIAFALWVSPHLSEPVFALAFGVLFAGFAQLLFQLPFLHQLHLMPRPVWNWHHPGVRKVLKLMLPAIFGVSVSQINLLLDTVLASFLPTGSVSWLYYSDRLTELPLGVFGIAIATVILPSLSRLYPQANSSAEPSMSEEGRESPVDTTKLAETFRATLDWALRCIVVIAIPASTALFVLAEPILYLLFQYDAMRPHDVEMAAFSLRAYSLGLLAFMAIKVLATGYYAQQDTKTPVKIGIIAMVANMVLNLIFVAILHWQFKLGHAGLALATSCSALLNALLLYRGLAHSELLSGLGRSILSAEFWRVLVSTLIASGVMAALLWQMLPVASFWIDAVMLERLFEVVVLCMAGLSSYLLVLLLMGMRPKYFIN